MSPLVVALALSGAAHAFDLGHLYVADGSVVRSIDPSTGLTSSTIGFGVRSAVDVKFSPDGATLYMLDDSQDFVGVYDTSGNRVDVFADGDLIDPTSLLVGPSGRLFVVDPTQATVFVYDDRGNLLTSAQDAALRSPFAVAQGGGKLYVTTTLRGVGVHVFDLASFPPTYEGVLPGSDAIGVARGLAIAGDNLFIADRGIGGGSALHKYDLLSRSNTVIATVIGAPDYVYASADRVYVSDSLVGPGGNGPVRVFDFDGNELARTANDANQPGGMDEYRGSEVPPVLAITGTCPGPLSVVITDLTPSGPVAILGGAGIGGEYLTAGSCAGLPTGLGAPIRLLGGGLFTADDTGEIRKSPTAGAGVCGTAVQVLDVTSCQLSNVHVL